MLRASCSERSWRANGVEEERRAALADAIRHWRDADDARGPNGAEDPEYQAEGRTAGAKDGFFNTVAELQQVLGISRRLYERLAPALTVHSRQTRANAKLAPPGVLRALLTAGSGPKTRSNKILAINATKQGTANQEPAPPDHGAEPLPLDKTKGKSIPSRRWPPCAGATSPAPSPT